MDKPFSRKPLALELIRRGVLPGYAWRVTGELADHADDLSAAGSGSSAKLGDVDQLATQIVDGYRRRTFAGRHPLLAFVVAPFPLVLMAYLAFWFVGALLIFAWSELTHLTSIGFLVIHVGSMCVPLTLVAAFICRLTRQAGLSWRKTLFACAPVLLVAGVLFSHVALESLEHGSFMFGICVPGFGRVLSMPAWPVPLINRVAQLSLPLCVMLWMFIRERAQAREFLQKGLECGDGPGQDDCAPCTAQAA